jgi:hypothetical protein
MPASMRNAVRVNKSFEYIVPCSGVFIHPSLSLSDANKVFRSGSRFWKISGRSKKPSQIALCWINFGKSSMAVDLP